MTNAPDRDKETAEPATPNGNGWALELAKKHSDKLLAMLISGIVGYFSALLAINRDLGLLDTRISINEERIENRLLPALEDIEDNAQTLSQHETDIEDLEDSDALAVRLSLQLRQFLDEERTRTLNELGQILEGER